MPLSHSQHPSGARVLHKNHHICFRHSTFNQLSRLSSHYSMATSTEFLQSQILDLDSIFQKACKQILLLNNFLRQLQIRYDRASRDNLRTYRYALRLRLCTVEGLRNALHEYATQQASKIEKMEDDMREMGQGPLVLHGYVSEESDEESDVDSD